MHAIKHEMNGVKIDEILYNQIMKKTKKPKINKVFLAFVNKF